MKSYISYLLFHVKHSTCIYIILLTASLYYCLDSHSVLYTSATAQEVTNEPTQKAVKEKTFSLKGVLDPYIKKGTLPGYVVMAGDREKVLCYDVSGVTNLESKKPMNKDTMFWIASMTKPITAVGFMILVDEGKVSLDDPVSKYIPEFNQLWVKEKVSKDQMVLVPAVKCPTLRQVLSHTGGFEFFTPYMHRFKIDSLPMDHMAVTAAMFPLKTQPGTEYNYSNSGINIASAVLEKVSGEKLEVFLQKRVFDPLEMKDTTFFPNEEQTSRLATPYTWDKNKKSLVAMPSVHFLNDNPYCDRTYRFAEAGGGLFSTAEDCFHFYQMLANKGTWHGKRIISEKSFAEITKDQTGLGKNYGLGMGVSPGFFGHGGAYGTSGGVLNGEKVSVLMIQLSGVPDVQNIRNSFQQEIAKQK